MTDEEAADTYAAAETGKVEALHGLLPMPPMSRLGVSVRRRELAALLA